MDFSSYLENNNQYDCVFRGIRNLGPCSTQKTLGIICDRHLDAVFNIALVEVVVFTSEFRNEEKIRFAAISSKARTERIFPFIYEYRNNDWCLRSDFHTILNNHVSSLNLGPDHQRVLAIMGVMLTSQMIYTTGGCESLPIIVNFINNQQLMNYLTNHWSTSQLNVLNSDSSISLIPASSLPPIYKVLLYPFFVSTIASSTTNQARTMNPSIIINLNGGTVSTTRSILLVTGSTTYASPAILAGIKTITGDISMYQQFKNPSINLINYGAFRYPPCDLTVLNANINTM